MVFRFVHCTDQHMSDRPTGNRIPSFPQEMRNKMIEVVQTCMDEDRHLIMTGDLFDDKRADRVTHRLTQWFIELFTPMRSKGLDVLAIAGNHDLGPEGMASLERQPLGVLLAAGAITLLRGQEVWNFDGMKLQISAFNYHEDGESDGQHFRTRRHKNVDRHIILAHGAMRPDRLTYPFPTIPYSEVPTDGVDAVFCGHLHHRYPLEVVNGATFVQYGSLSRRSAVQKRKVGIAVGEISKEAIHVEERFLKCALPWQEIFIEKELLPEVLMNPDMADLARDAREMLSFDDVDFNVVIHKLSAGLKPTTLHRVEQYIEAAGGFAA